MAVLLLGEVTDGALSLDATAKAVTAMQSLGDVTVLCAGAKAADAAAEASLRCSAPRMRALAIVWQSRRRR